MTSPDPLLQLYDLHKYKSLPQFHSKFRNIIGGKEYRERVPHLRGDDLAWLVEYLDSVSLQIALPHSILNIVVGS